MTQTPPSQNQPAANAVVIAGGRDKPELLAAGRARSRSLMLIAGRSMIERTLSALREAESVARIAVVAPAEIGGALDAAWCDEFRPSVDSPAQNLLLGAQAVGEDLPILLSTGDLPLLTAESVDDFVARGLATGADVVYPIVSAHDCERRFPGAPRTYARLREGTFTGGNIVLTRGDFVRTHLELIDRLFELRKHKLRLANLFGWSFLIRFALGRLNLRDLEARGTAIIGGRVAALVSSYPEIGFDVDKVDDLELARRVLRDSKQ
jgi:GTP:adenosylcobinamide-phosphate guanylyltransferase